MSEAPKIELVVSQHKTWMQSPLGSTGKRMTTPKHLIVPWRKRSETTKNQSQRLNKPGQSIKISLKLNKWDPNRCLKHQRINSNKLAKIWLFLQPVGFTPTTIDFAGEPTTLKKSFYRLNFNLQDLLALLRPPVLQANRWLDRILCP